jgi:MoxR-like ATPase
VVLADEINRAPAKVQSALLEAMEEKQVTLGETSYPLPDPFFVLATENPIEHEGTYALPEAELDRFLLKLLVSYPGPEEELEIIRRNAALPGGANGSLGPQPLSSASCAVALDASALELLRRAADSVHIDEKITEYIVSIVTATRPAATRPYSPALRAGNVPAREGLYRNITFGASPRASIALHRCSRIRALFEGRRFAGPEDVKAAAFPVLRHRIVLSYEAEADGLDADGVIARILSHVPVP